MQPLISVIVPVYNVEKHMRACVDSLLAQTYPHIEILLIDDGSTDDSAHICDEYQAQDARIRVIHKQNAGVAQARNTGLEQMRGDYFCFVDSDDTVHKEYLSLLYQLLTENNADLSMCMYHFKWPDGREKRTRNAEYPDNHIFRNTGKDALRKMFYSDIYAPSCWCKLYKKENSDIRFPHFAIGEDMVFVTDQLLRADKVVMSNRPLYDYRQNEESVMHSVNPDKVYDVVLSGDEIPKKLPRQDKKLQRAASFYIVEKNLSAMMKLYTQPNQKKRLAHIAHNIKTNRVRVLTDANAKPIVRINCLFSFLGIRTLYRIKSLHNQ